MRTFTIKRVVNGESSVNGQLANRDAITVLSRMVDMATAIGMMYIAGTAGMCGVELYDSDDYVSVEVDGRN